MTTHAQPAVTTTQARDLRWYMDQGIHWMVELIGVVDRCAEDNEGVVSDALVVELDAARNAVLADLPTAAATVEALGVQATHARETARALSARAASLDTLAEGLRDRIKTVVASEGVVPPKAKSKVLDAGPYRLREQASQASLVTADDLTDEKIMEAWPEDCWELRLTRKADAVKARLKRGETVDGARLETGTHLRIEVVG